MITTGETLTIIDALNTDSFPVLRRQCRARGSPRAKTWKSYRRDCNVGYTCGDSGQKCVRDTIRGLQDQMCRTMRSKYKSGAFKPNLAATCRRQKFAGSILHRDQPCDDAPRCPLSTADNGEDKYWPGDCQSKCFKRTPEIISWTRRTGGFTSGEGHVAAVSSARSANEETSREHFTAPEACIDGARRVGRDEVDQARLLGAGQWNFQRHVGPEQLDRRAKPSQWRRRSRTALAIDLDFAMSVDLGRNTYEADASPKRLSCRT